MDDAPSTASPADIERRAVWLAVAAALVLILRGSATSFFVYGSGGNLDRQLWFFIASAATLGASVLLAGLVALPELIAYPAQISTRWNPVRLFGWAVLLFVAGVLLTAIAGIFAAADAIGTNPFNQ